MKPTQKALAEYIGKTPRTLQHMCKVNPRMYYFLLSGWIAYVSEHNSTGFAVSRNMTKDEINELLSQLKLSSPKQK